MARGGFSRRRGPAPVKLYAILGGIAILLIVGVLFSAVGMVMWRMRRAPEDEAA